MSNATIIIWGMLMMIFLFFPLYLKCLSNVDSGRCVIVERALKRPDFSVLGKGLFKYVCLSLNLTTLH